MEIVLHALIDEYIYMCKVEAMLEDLTLCFIYIYIYIAPSTKDKIWPKFQSWNN